MELKNIFLVIVFSILEYYDFIGKDISIAKVGRSYPLFLRLKNTHF